MKPSLASEYLNGYTMVPILHHGQAIVQFLNDLKEWPSFQDLQTRFNVTQKSLQLLLRSIAMTDKVKQMFVFFFVVLFSIVSASGPPKTTFLRFLGLEHQGPFT